VIVRKDIPLAHQAVQAVHAGISSARDLISPDLIHPSLVLCTVPDKAALMAVQDRCNAAGVRNRVFVESDMGDEPTALATEPINGKGRKLFQKLPLFTGA
jgi:hypothetical protein